MTKPTPERRAKLCSFRLEDENLASIDELALKQGVSRSQWIRQAVLAELVLELAGHKIHEAVTHTEVEQQDLPDEPSVDELDPPSMEELGDRPPPLDLNEYDHGPMPERLEVAKWAPGWTPQVPHETPKPDLAALRRMAEADEARTRRGGR